MWQEENRVCPVCGADFYPEQHNQKYCSDQHKVAAENKRWYESHKRQRIEEIQAKRYLKRLPEEIKLADLARWLSLDTLRHWANGTYEPRLNAYKRHDPAFGMKIWYVRREDVFLWLKARKQIGKMRVIARRANDESQ